MREQFEIGSKVYLFIQFFCRFLRLENSSSEKRKRQNFVFQGRIGKISSSKSKETEHFLVPGHRTVTMVMKQKIFDQLYVF